MHIIERNPALTYPRDIQQEKRLIVLSWLLEFQFSSPRILAQLLEQPATSTSRFFARMLEQRFIRTFENVHTNRERLFMLDRTGIDFLMNHELNVDNACTKPHVLHRYRFILHDQAVQESVIHKMHGHTEVIWDKHITHIDGDSRPDALMRMKKGYWVALDYERWRKSADRIYRMYHHHAQAIEQERYHGVYLFFHSDQDRQYYQTLFDSEKWPVVSKNQTTGKLTHTKDDYYPDRIKNLRATFLFEVLCCEGGKLT